MCFTSSLKFWTGSKRDCSSSQMLEEAKIFDLEEVMSGEATTASGDQILAKENTESWEIFAGTELLCEIFAGSVVPPLEFLREVSADQKGRLLMSTERLNQSSERIKEGRKTMLETEELGVSILQDLHQPRQSLLHAYNTLHGVDDNIGKSKKILTACQEG
ncbi:hypothetical protein NE237_022502 [Protea cynaroides]|uniref:Uncharacterized protein n=1 Tax=Protea cynaroides TaxID=273540 RepID=A0A9Q0HAI5_9MAGN|nr:hypothetical protein NE237_022502 [Protea cynaroides]